MGQISGLGATIVITAQGQSHNCICRIILENYKGAPAYKLNIYKDLAAAAAGIWVSWWTTYHVQMPVGKDGHSHCDWELVGGYNA